MVMEIELPDGRVGEMENETRLKLDNDTSSLFALVEFDDGSTEEVKIIEYNR